MTLFSSSNGVKIEVRKTIEVAFFCLDNFEYNVWGFDVITFCYVLVTVSGLRLAVAGMLVGT